MKQTKTEQRECVAKGEYYSRKTTMPISAAVEEMYDLKGLCHEKLILCILSTSLWNKTHQSALCGGLHEQ